LAQTTQVDVQSAGVWVATMAHLNLYTDKNSEDITMPMFDPELSLEAGSQEHTAVITWPRRSLLASHRDRLAFAMRAIGVPPTDDRIKVFQSFIEKYTDETLAHAFETGKPINFASRFTIKGEVKPPAPPRKQRAHGVVAVRLQQRTRRIVYIAEGKPAKGKATIRLLGGGHKVAQEAFENNEVRDMIKNAKETAENYKSALEFYNVDSLDNFDPIAYIDDEENAMSTTPSSFSASSTDTLVAD
jgi:hypothetical protein